MTSSQASSIFESLEVGAVFVALLAYYGWLGIKAYFARRQRREDAGEIPYVRDEERAKLIAQHPLLTMQRKKGGAA